MSAAAGGGDDDPDVLERWIPWSNRLASVLLQYHFGEVVAEVASTLLEEGSLPFGALEARTNDAIRRGNPALSSHAARGIREAAPDATLTRQQVADCVLILMQHGLVEARERDLSAPVGDMSASKTTKLGKGYEGKTDVTRKPQLIMEYTIYPRRVFRRLAFARMLAHTRARVRGDDELANLAVALVAVVQCRGAVTQGDAIEEVLECMQAAEHLAERVSLVGSPAADAAAADPTTGPSPAATAIGALARGTLPLSHAQEREALVEAELTRQRNQRAKPPKPSRAPLRAHSAAERAALRSRLEEAWQLLAQNRYVLLRPPKFATSSAAGGRAGGGASVAVQPIPSPAEQPVSNGTAAAGARGAGASARGGRGRARGVGRGKGKGASDGDAGPARKRARGSRVIDDGDDADDFDGVGVGMAAAAAASAAASALAAPPPAGPQQPPSALWALNSAQFIREMRHQHVVMCAEQRCGRAAAALVGAVLCRHRRSEGQACPDADAATPYFSLESISEWVHAEPLAELYVGPSAALVETAAEAVAGGVVGPDAIPTRIRDALPTPQAAVRALAALASEPHDASSLQQPFAQVSGGKLALGPRCTGCIHSGLLMEFWRERTLETLIRDKYGPSLARVFRVVRSEGKAEEKTVAKLAILSVKECRAHLYRLLMAGYVALQEVPKSAERTPQRTIYLWYVDLKAAMLAALSEHTKVLLNTQLRLMDERARSEAAGEYQGPLPHAEELLLLKVPGRVEHERRLMIEALEVATYRLYDAMLVFFEL